MRTYGQYCGLAKALDVIGDRWTLLLVRELLIRGACRYTDLRNGLPGIATNLLAERIEQLEHAGLLRREAAPPPVATTLFHLTERGKELEPVLYAIGRWGAAAMGPPEKGDAYCSHWLALPLNLHLADRSPEEPPIALEIRSGDEPLILETIGDGTIHVRVGTVPHPDGRLEGDPLLVLGLLAAKLDLKTARARGLKYDGDQAILRRIGPRQEAPTTLRKAPSAVAR